MPNTNTTKTSAPKGTGGSRTTSSTGKVSTAVAPPEEGTKTALVDQAIEAPVSNLKRITAPRENESLTKKLNDGNLPAGVVVRYETRSGETVPVFLKRD